MEWDEVALGVFFPIRVGFDGLCRWVEWDKVALGVFFPSGWDWMDCAPLLLTSFYPNSQEDTRYLFESCKTECQVDEDCGSNEKCCDYILGECQQNVCLKAV